MKEEDKMDLILNIILYLVVAIFLVVFFRKAIEMFLLIFNKISEKYNKEKED